MTPTAETRYNRSLKPTVRITPVTVTPAELYRAACDTASLRGGGK